LDIITPQEADALVEAAKAGGLFAQDPNSPRNVLLRDIREAHTASGKAAPVAAVLTKADLASRGLWNDTGKRQGPKVKAGRNGKGEVRLVRTLDDGRVLIILNDHTEA
jgi:hypothetical protein